MKIFYSPSTKGFYNDTLKYNSLPEDLIEITEEKYDYLLSGVQTGKMICNIGDELYLGDIPEETPTWNSIRSTRNRLLSQSDFSQLPDYPGDKTAWATYRKKLRDLPQLFKKPEDVIWPTKPA